MWIYYLILQSVDIFPHTVKEYDIFPHTPDIHGIVSTHVEVVCLLVNHKNIINQKPMYMKDWLETIDDYLKIAERKEKCSMNEGLSRFYEAHQRDYPQALREISNGRKSSHWIWYIFPQLKGLGHSYRAEYYGIQDLDEAKAYLADSVLGADLIEICGALLALDTDDALAVMGSPDHIKLKSSMTLFNEVSTSDVFGKVLDKFFQGEKDQRTLEMIGVL